MTTAYSYTRFSTAEQQFGDSERRQLALAESYCARNGLKLADTISDKGISAFHGRHRQSGALGRLLKRLKPGDALIVEDSDRLSREAPLTALTALYAAVNGGIEVHFLRTGTVVNAANFNDVSVIVPNFFGSLLANQESKKKGERVKASWAARRAAIAKGLPARFRLPCWLEWSAEQGKVTVNEAKAAIVKRLFRLAGEGHGVLAIARLLNQEGVKPITGSKRACWNLTSLRRILLGKEAIGFYVPGTGEPVANYFPAVVSEAEFYAAQSRLGDAKKIKARTASTANLFVGLAHCRRCGAAIWPRMLEDALQGRLKNVYRADSLPGLAGLPLPRYDLLSLRRYAPFNTFVVVSSRGCPFRCEFCSERFLLGDGYRCRPVSEVVEEIKYCPSRNFLFGDSNFGGKRSHAMQLMEALIPLKVRWSALWSSYVCLDKEFMDLAQRSGLLHLNIGIESINPDTLGGMNKRFNKVHRYAEMLAGLRRRGISYSLNFIFGWDGETAGAFHATLKFLEDHKVPAAYFNILTPVKGTPLYDRLRGEGRLLNIQDIDRWPGQMCHFQPCSGTAAALESNVREIHQRFYRWRSILTRLPVPMTKASIASWIINLSQRRVAQASQAHNNFDGY